jgi:hypothetical protein
MNKSRAKKTSVLIDKITNSIEDAKSGKSLETDVLPITKSEIKTILKKNGWQFNWRMEFRETNRQLFKLVLRGDSNVQGLLSIEVMNGYIEMHLIESAPHNFGKEKAFIGVAGNLVAFACKMSFDLGFDGYLSFRPKTKLFDHYKETLGAERIFRDRMQIATDSAKKLVNSYYKNYI